jgi:predicted transcriptional regulator of viral defense system
MRFEELLVEFGDLPLFRGSLLLAGDRDPADVRRQLSRWRATGKVIQLRRDLYMLAKPWRRRDPHPFLVANELQRPSYVSLQSALSYHGLIPELVPVTTSVTASRPGVVETRVGRFDFRHVHRDAFFGYGRHTVVAGQPVLLADPAKALLDLVYLTPGGDSIDFLAALRLEGLESVRETTLRAHVDRWDRPKLRRARDAILALKEAA